MKQAILCSALFLGGTALMATEGEGQAKREEGTEFKEVTIHLRGNKAVTSALLDAVDEGATVTGISDFDSLSAVYGLMGIYRKGVSLRIYGHRFRLRFPPDSDVADIAGAYRNLPYITGGGAMTKEGIAARATGVEIGTLFGISDISGPYDNWTSINVPGGIFSGFGMSTLYVSQFPSERIAIGQEISFARVSYRGSLTTLLAGVRVAFFPTGKSKPRIYALGQGFLRSTSLVTDADDDNLDTSQAELVAGCGVGYQWRLGPALVLRMEGQYRRWVDSEINNLLLVLGLGTRLGNEIMAKKPSMGMGVSVPKMAPPDTEVEVGTLFGITHNFTRERTTIEVPDGGIGGVSLPALYVLNFPSERVAVGSEIAHAKLSYFGSATTVSLGVPARFLPSGNSRSGICLLGQGSLFSVLEDDDSETDFSAEIGMGYQWRIGPALVLRMEGKFQRWLDARSNNVLLVLGLGTRLGRGGD